MHNALSRSGPDPLADALFGRIRRRHGVELDCYREDVLLPQLELRMQTLGLGSIHEYLALIESAPCELARLLDTLVIGSTSFYRDPLAFIAVARWLAQQARRTAQELRIWVAGCSTGEEAYSLAIAVHETLLARGEECSVRIYATDVRESALQTARRAHYASRAFSSMTPERRDRYFQQAQGGYTVCPVIRQMVIFGRHDLLLHPPFSRLDLVSCRNVLMYLTPRAQEYVLRRIHFGLRAQGALLLGMAESPTVASNKFCVLDREHRFYQKSAHSPSARGTPEEPWRSKI